MKIYEFKLNTFPSSLTVYAQCIVEAASLFDAWHTTHMGASPDQLRVEVASSGRAVDDPDIEGPIRFGQSGIGSWVPGMGWMALPPDFDAPGTYYRETRPVRGYRFADIQTTNFDPIVFAATVDDAEKIYVQWLEFNAGIDCDGNFMSVFDPGLFAEAAPGLSEAAAMGITGVAGVLEDQMAILPPWHIGAGRRIEELDIR